MDTAPDFEGFSPAQHVVEVEERWGTSEAHVESRREGLSYFVRDAIHALQSNM